MRSPKLCVRKLDFAAKIEDCTKPFVRYALIAPHSFAALARQQALLPNG